jgi:TolB-like protein
MWWRTKSDGGCRPDRKARNLFIFVVLSVFLFGTFWSSAQSFDKELDEVATSVAKSLQGGERKKATVLDFTDLEGNVNQLGRFIAEQLSVSLVMNRKGFAVLDRSNLKKILEEHKLTIAGLVEPENAKKLGQFSGVDTIILGTITPLKDELVITVKIIATDTAEIVGAAKTRIPKSKDLETMLTSTISSGSGEKPNGDGSEMNLTNLVHVQKTSTQVGDVLVHVESLRPVHQNGREYMLATVAMVNTNASTPVLASIRYPGSAYSTLTDREGRVFITLSGQPDIIGIGTGSMSGRPPNASEFTEIEPRKSIIVTIHHVFPNDDGSRKEPTTPSSYRLQFTIAVATDVQRGKLINGKTRAILIEAEPDK